MRRDSLMRTKPRLAASGMSRTGWRRTALFEITDSRLIKTCKSKKLRPPPSNQHSKRHRYGERLAGFRRASTCTSTKMQALLYGGVRRVPLGRLLVGWVFRKKGRLRHHTPPHSLRFVLIFEEIGGAARQHARTISMKAIVEVQDRTGGQGGWAGRAHRD